MYVYTYDVHVIFPLNACALSMETDIKQIGHNAVKSKNALRRTATKRLAKKGKKQEETGRRIKLKTTGNEVDPE